MKSKEDMQEGETLNNSIAENIKNRMILIARELGAPHNARSSLQDRLIMIEEMNSLHEIVQENCIHPKHLIMDYYSISPHLPPLVCSFCGKYISKS